MNEMRMPKGRVTIATNAESVRAGVPENGGPIAVMKAEHDQGRAAVAALDAAAAAYAEHGPAERDGVIRAIDAIAALYPSHIFKEDNVLYPMARAHLPPA